MILSDNQSSSCPVDRLKDDLATLEKHDDLAADLPEMICQDEEGEE